MTADELHKIKKRLPNKWAVILAETTGLSRIYVVKVMAGESENLQILEAALQLAELTDAKKKDLTRRVAKLH